MNASRPLQLIPLLLFLAGIVLGADVSGKWNFQVNLDAGSGSPTFTFKQDGETLTGAYAGRLGSAKVSGAVNRAIFLRPARRSRTISQAGREPSRQARQVWGGEQVRDRQTSKSPSLGKFIPRDSDDDEESPQCLDHCYQALSGGPFRHLSDRTGRALYQGGNQRARMLSRVRRTVAAACGSQVHCDSHRQIGRAHV